jgi:peptide-methionine (S)-S-oxide reductase
VENQICIEKIGLGGGCHWCTEAVFQSLRGVIKVEQGWIAAKEDQSFSEAVIVHFNPEEINLEVLLGVHLHTHSSTANHSMRNKYRSAIYIFTEHQQPICEEILIKLQEDFEKPFVTRVLSFESFQTSPEIFRNYYYNDSTKPFCKTFIEPKLKMLLQKFSSSIVKYKF